MTTWAWSVRNVDQEEEAGLDVDDVIGTVVVSDYHHFLKHSDWLV